MIDVETFAFQIVSAVFVNVRRRSIISKNSPVQHIVLALLKSDVS